MNSPASPSVNEVSQEPTHAPGPWEVCHDHPDEKSKAAIGYIRPLNRKYESDESDEVAIVFGCDYEGGKQEANARLIAAAPEMLLALKDIRDFLRRSGYDIRLVDGVIKKATGRASGEKT